MAGKPLSSKLYKKKKATSSLPDATRSPAYKTGFGDQARDISLSSRSPFPWDAMMVDPHTSGNFSRGEVHSPIENVVGRNSRLGLGVDCDDYGSTHSLPTIVMGKDRQRRIKPGAESSTDTPHQSKQSSSQTTSEHKKKKWNRVFKNVRKAVMISKTKQ